MTLSEARAAAAGAIRAAATSAQVRRVLEVDVLHERQIPAIAQGLTPGAHRHPRRERSRGRVRDGDRPPGVAGHRHHRGA